MCFSVASLAGTGLLHDGMMCSDSRLELHVLKRLPRGQGVAGGQARPWHTPPICARHFRGPSNSELSSSTYHTPHGSWNLAFPALPAKAGC